MSMSLRSAIGRVAWVGAIAWRVLWAPRSGMKLACERVGLPTAAVLACVLPWCFVLSLWVAMGGHSESSVKGPASVWALVTGVLAVPAAWLGQALLLHIANLLVRTPSSLRRLAVGVAFSWTPYVAAVPVALVFRALHVGLPPPSRSTVLLWNVADTAEQLALVGCALVWPLALMGVANAYANGTGRLKGWLAWGVYALATNAVAIPALVWAIVGISAHRFGPAVVH